MAVSYKPGKYPSKLDWSLLGHVLGYIYCTEVRTDQAMLPLSSNGERGAGLRVTGDKWQRCALSEGAKRNREEEKPGTAARVKGNDVIDKR